MALLAVTLRAAVVMTGNAIVASVSIVLVFLGLVVCIINSRPLLRRRGSAMNPTQNDRDRLAATAPSDGTGLEIEKEERDLKPYLPEEPDTSKEEAREELYHAGRPQAAMAPKVTPHLPRRG
jgi:hypothetical protein